MLKGVSGDPCEKWREPSIPGLGNIILLGQAKNAVHASLPDPESPKVVCVRATSLAVLYQPLRPNRG